METFFYLPTKIFLGQGAIGRLEEIHSFRKKPLIVTGKTFTKNCDYFLKIKDVLAGKGFDFAEFCEVEPEPCSETVEKGAQLCRKHGCDSVIGFGGGSPIDAAKAIAILATNKGRLPDYYGEADIKTRPLPVVAIPTTAGTGSEVTRYSVIIDKSLNLKKTISSAEIIPKIAIIDPLVTLGLPANLTAFTGLDAFSHAIEGYLSSKADYFSDVFAIESMKAVSENLPVVLKNPEDVRSREKMMYAAMLAGIELNATGTIIVHGMGYALGLRYKLQHGQANALLLYSVIEHLYKFKEYKERLEILNDKLGNDVGEIIKNLIKCADLPLNLKEAGFDLNDMGILAKDAFVNCERSFKRLRIKMDINNLKEILKISFGA